MTDPTDAVRLALLDTSEFERLAPEPPDGGLGYGADLAGIDDITERAEMRDPNSVESIWENLVRRWSTPRGKLDEARGEGLDVSAMLNEGIAESDIPSIAGRLADEARNDDRIRTIDVELVRLTSNTFSIPVRIVPADPNLKPFSRVLRVESGEQLQEALE